MSRLRVYVCDGPTCGDARGADGLVRRLQERRAADPGFADDVLVSRETCFGHCVRGPNVMVCVGPDVDWMMRSPLIGTPGTSFHSYVDEETIVNLCERYRAGLGPPVAALMPGLKKP